VERKVELYHNAKANFGLMKTIVFTKTKQENLLENDYVFTNMFSHHNIWSLN